MVTEISDSDFEEKVIKASVPVMVDFWAPWCGPCRMVSPILEDLSDEVGSDAIICKMNVDENPLTAQKFGISAIPTVIVFKNGQEDKKLIGVQPKGTYLSSLS